MLQTGLAPALLAVLAVSLLLASCAQKQGAAPVAEVLAAWDCPEPRCISRSQAAQELGFAIWEPLELPAGFAIYERQLRTPRIGQSPPGTETSQVSLGEAPPVLETSRVSAVLLLDYRFKESLNVAGIVITEAAHASPGTKLHLSVPGESCGEVLKGKQGVIVYINGLAEAQPAASEGEWSVCRVPESPPRNAHTVMLTRGHVLIEVLAFPEAGVSREEILRLAESFVEAK